MNVCIELYYLDKDITQPDKENRRLYLSTEFDRKSQRHISEDLNCTDIEKLRTGQIKIIDNRVYNRGKKNIALTKNDFAMYVSTLEKGFDNLGIDEFSLIFDMIRKIVAENQ